MGDTPVIMMRWSVWPRNGACGTHWLTAREILGNQDGDGPAAMRYTEARLERLAEHMLDDIEKDTVDFQFNFDDSEREPSILPTRIPQLLVNGSSGIAVGMATNMMPHNLSEVIDGCIAFIANREITIEELMQHVKAPDFPNRWNYLWNGRCSQRHAFRAGQGSAAWKLHVIQSQRNSQI